MESDDERRSRSAEQPHLSPSQPQSNKHGGWTAVKFILGNESFEKLASMSLIANMTVYLSTEYNLSGVFLVNVVNIWMGSTNISSILGAIVSDAYLGRFLTLLYGTICTFLGMAGVTSTAAISKLRPPHCRDQIQCIQPKKWQLSYLFTSLTLISLGAGGIRPCNIAFGADQFDTKTEKGKAQLESFFNWWYFSFTIALIIALIGVVYIQTNISWSIGFAIPTACLVISITVFLIGRHTYVCKRPEGSVFKDLARVIVASFRKRDLKYNCDRHSFYDPKGDLESSIKNLNRFKFLDKAAVITDPSELDREGKPVNQWRLCSVQQVEDIKSLIGVLPVWIAGVGCFLVMDQQSTFGILQALQMNRSIGTNHFIIPPGWMGITSMVALSIWILIYEHIYLPIAKKIWKKPSSITMQQRIRIGIIMAIICMIVAGFVEMKRRSLALKYGSFASPLHVAALLPQFMLSGLTEAFAAVALMEFFTIQLPESMRSVAGAIFFLSLSVASYLSSLLVNIMRSMTGSGGEAPWLGGHDLNQNKLHYYYFVIAWLGLLDLIYFTLIASKFVVVLSEKDHVHVGGEVEMENTV